MDIVERLRKLDFIYYPDNAADISIEAADEIVRLREALNREQQIDFVLDNHGIAHKNFVIVYKNRAALKDDE